MLAPVHRIPQSLSVRCADDASLGDVHRRVEIDGVVAWAKFATLRLSYHGDGITLLKVFKTTRLSVQSIRDGSPWPTQHHSVFSVVPYSYSVAACSISTWSEGVFCIGSAVVRHEAGGAVHCAEVEAVLPDL